jgi:hypothetical protein
LPTYDPAEAASDVPASQVVADEVRRAAVARIATLGPRLVARVVRSTADVAVTPTATRHEAEALTERLRSGGPLSPLGDPESGQDRLGPSGVHPGSVGDLLEARGTDGFRVANELRRQCALEAARMAPTLADQLATSHAGLAEALAHEHAAPLVDGPRQVDPAAVLCAEVASLLAIELLTVVEDQMGDVPVSPNPPTR